MRLIGQAQYLLLVLALAMAPTGLSAGQRSHLTPFPQDAYKDLPGVKKPQSDPDASQSVCESRIERTSRYWRARNRLGQRVYSCALGENVVVKSNRQPDEIDWRKQKNYYKPWIGDGFDR